MNLFTLPLAKDDDLWNLEIGVAELKEFFEDPVGFLRKQQVVVEPSFTLMYRDARRFADGKGKRVKRAKADHYISGGGLVTPNRLFAAWGIRGTGMILMEGPRQTSTRVGAAALVESDEFTSQLRADKQPLVGAWHAKMTDNANPGAFVHSCIVDRQGIEKWMSQVLWLETELDAQNKPVRQPIPSLKRTFRFAVDPLIYWIREADEATATALPRCPSCYAGRFWVAGTGKGVRMVPCIGSKGCN